MSRALPRKYFGPEGLPCVFTVSEGNTVVGYLKKQISNHRFIVTDGDENTVQASFALSTDAVSDLTALPVGTFTIVLMTPEGEQEHVRRLTSTQCVTVEGNGWAWHNADSTDDVAGIVVPSLGYAAKAARFASDAYLECLDTGLTTSAKFMISYWFKVDDVAKLGVIDIFPTYAPGGTIQDHGYFGEFAGSPNTDANFYVEDATGVNYYILGTPNGVAESDVWHHYIMGADTSTSTPTGYIIVDGVVSDLPTNYDNDHAFVGGWTSGNLPGHTNGGPPTEAWTSAIEFCDVQCWVGICPDMTDPENIAKLIVDGKPVDPATAAEAFGAPDFLFSGDATTFINNQGTTASWTSHGTITTGAVVQAMFDRNFKSL
jgi:hypothetical protein